MLSAKAQNGSAIKRGLAIARRLSASSTVPRVSASSMVPKLLAPSMVPRVLAPYLAMVNKVSAPPSNRTFDINLERFINNIPPGWFRTTYPNDARCVGVKDFKAAVQSKLFGDDAVNLFEVNPSDYSRVSGPMDATLEVVRAHKFECDHNHVYSFSSSTFPLISTLFSSTSKVHIYGECPFTERQKNILKQDYNFKFEFHTGDPKQHGDESVVLIENSPSKELDKSNIDAIVSSEGLLYILDPTKILPDEIATYRKRFLAPPSSQDAFDKLFCQPSPRAPDTADLKNHLKLLAGNPDTEWDPLITGVGLSALYACTMAAKSISEGNVDIVMASTAYGGSSQQSDILANKLEGITKHTFDIQGDSDVLESLRTKLGLMAKRHNDAIGNVTIIQIEYPTNPDMKDVDLAALEKVCNAYEEATGSKVLLVLDTTFSPQSKPLRFLKEIPVMVFNSLSKSVSGGLDTGGALVASGNEFAQKVLRWAHVHAKLSGSYATAHQLKVFNKMYSTVETRIEDAHKNAKNAVTILKEAVKDCTGSKMKVNFVTEAQIKNGVKPATLSFNLPVPSGSQYEGDPSNLAQDFVNLLVKKAGGMVIPCVSFGQDGNKIYVTVPSTSTQGAISEEDKAKQAVGGVQLVRISCPTNMDIDNFKKALTETLSSLYPLKSRL
jgi:cystathionine beta-lyase/cystathionine gamma-synthase